MGPVCCLPGSGQLTAAMLASVAPLAAESSVIFGQLTAAMLASAAPLAAESSTNFGQLFLSQARALHQASSRDPYKILGEFGRINDLIYGKVTNRFLVLNEYLYTESNTVYYPNNQKVYFGIAIFMSFV